MRHLETSILIKAPKSVVWNILTDLNAYPEWNPLIKKSKGDVKVGNRIENEMHLSGQKPQTFKPKLLVVQPEKELRWLGSLLIKGIFDGEHYFILENTPEGYTQLKHGEHFSGILSGFIMRQIGEATEKGFQDLNQALKARSEQRVNA